MTDSFKKTLSLALVFLVNLLFCVKYFSRYTALWPVFTLGILVAAAAFWEYRAAVSAWLSRFRIYPAVIVIGYLLVLAILLTFLPKESLNVDRWSVIASFWQKVFDGGYAYEARSFDNNSPGPMPFYFILALPFLLLGELGYFSMVGVLVFAWMIRSCRNRQALLLLLFASAWLLWEVLTRSNVFTNGMLVLVTIVLFFRYFQRKPAHILLFGLLFGLLVSTRNVFVIPYLIMGIYALRKKMLSFPDALLMGIAAAFSFVLTFIPFVWNHYDAFKEMNPFIVQSTFLMPFGYTVVFILAGMGSAWFCKKPSDVYFFSGFILFLTITGYFCYVLAAEGFTAAYTESGADVSYFILCIPFLLQYILEVEQSTPAIA